MKTKIIYFIIATLLLPVIVQAEIEAQHRCQNLLCVEGTPVQYSFEVDNNLNKTIVVSEFVIVEKNTQEIMLLYDEVTYILPPGEIVSLNMSVPLTLPVSGYTFYYVPCVNVSSLSSAESEFVCGQIIKTLTVTPKEKVECVNDLDCRPGLFCNRTHYCHPLQCDDDEAFIGNQCLELVCGKWEYAKDHGCVEKNIVKFMPYIIIGAIILIAILLFIGRKEISIILNSKGDKDKVVRRKRRS